jgi:hypothetical protein
LLGAKVVYCTDGVESVVQLASDNVRRVAAAAAATATTTTSVDANDKDHPNPDEDPAASDDPAAAAVGTPSTVTAVTTTTFVINRCPIHVQKYWWGTDVPPFMSISRRKSKMMMMTTTTTTTTTTTQSPTSTTPLKSSTVTETTQTEATSTSEATTPQLPTEPATLILVADCVLPKLYPIEPLVQAIDECLAPYQCYHDGHDDDDIVVVSNDDECTNQTASPATTSPAPTTRTSREVVPMALLSYEHRYYPDYDPRTKFRELAHGRQLKVETISNQDLDATYRLDDIELWRVTRETEK